MAGRMLQCGRGKVEGGYESIFDLDGEELVVNVVPFEITATVLEERPGRKPTSEEVEEETRKLAGDPKVLDALPPLPRRGEEGLGEITNNWERVRRYLGMSDLEGKMAVLKKTKGKRGYLSRLVKGVEVCPLLWSFPQGIILQ